MPSRNNQGTGLEEGGGGDLEQLLLVGRLQGGLSGGQEGAARVIDKVKGQSAAWNAIARRVEPLEPQDASLKHAAAALLVNVCL